ncbi:hypothetical protein H2200_000591 [Cladophialophora chaetospira]|uniref:DUF7492 domain-containing protein n=1 Tax=Cladophialophora chaetospira TaxID=386627 RepID=A0AA39CR47_9EURO|nr:hypothetical protein H2200_000591 [Cladophialophora chaetospira]
MQINSVFSSALLGLLVSARLAVAHTWVEQLMVIAPNGTLVGQPGFPRGNVLRGTPAFSDPTMVNLIPPDGRTINQIYPSDLMCKSTQTSETQTDGSPRLQAAPGDGIALRFQENGHVTLPDNQPGKPQNRGTIYVYGTTKPSPDDSFLAIHRVWNADGTGGDGRGRLISTRNFDDGQCYQVNGGAISQQRQQQFKHDFDMVMGNDLWCQQDIQLPSDLSTGSPYTLYWVWDWPTMPGTFGFPDGKQEIYTTCMDIDIVGDSGIVPVSKAQVSYAQQPYDIAAVADQMSDLSNPTAVTGQTIPFSSVPTTFLTRTASSTTSTSSSLTSSTPTGSTIAFSASATGPAAGGASEASVSAATATDTGVPGFLSVHTGSVAGPGLETQTFSVIPIGVTDSPQVTGTPNAVGNAQQVATFTEYESVTQTVYQTQYVTKYTKRGESDSYIPTSLPAEPNFPAPSQFPGPGYQYPNHPHHGPPGPGGPWFNGSWASRPSGSFGRPTGWPKQNTNSSESNYGYDPSNYAAATTNPATVSVAGYSSSGSLPTFASETISSSAITPAASPPVAASDSFTSTITAASTVTIIPTTSTASSYSASSFLPSSENQSLTVVPISDAVATPTPSITASTDHSAFRLRARNPFVLLGWMSGSSKAETTQPS